MTRPRRPPRAPTQPSPYDGYENYRERLDNDPRRIRPRHYAAAVLAIGVAIAAATLAYSASGILTALLTGVLAFIVYIVALTKTHGRSGPSLYYVIAAGLGVIGVAAFYPFGIDSLSLDPRERAAATAAARAVERERARQALASKNPVPVERWLARLYELERFGAPGATPPMLDAVSEGGGEEVISRTRETLIVSVSRVLRDSTAAGGWRGCALYAASGRESYVHVLDPWERVVFVLPATCGEEFRSADTEFRIGNETTAPELGWWSTSAFAAPLGRELEHGAGDSIEPVTFDAADWFDDFRVN